jgi:DNA-binding MarR family transcriptional regulator
VEVGAPPPNSRTANLLGALALAVADRCLQTAGRLTGHAESEAAALSAIDQFLDGPSVDRISAVIGLSQSGTVRLVDRLERQGLVRRGPGGDGRVTTVTLTPEGRKTAYQIEAARLRLLEEVLAPLEATEREVLAELTGKLLVGMMREPGATRWTCRLCDLGACGRPTGHCPIEQEAGLRYGRSGGSPTPSAGRPDP